MIQQKWYQVALKSLFLFANLPLLLVNLADSVYFKYTQRRSTYDIIDSVMADDFRSMLGAYLRDYWYIDIAVLGLFLLVWKFYPRIEIKTWSTPKITTIGIQWLSVLFIIALTAGIIRGLDHRPIAITSASKHVHPQAVSLALNTPFTIIKTINKEGLALLQYYKEDEITKYFSPIKQYQSKPFNRLNVVVIILESFGKEYSHLHNPQSPGYTPFLDSLSQKGLYFRYSFANGKRSMEALPSIFNSSPSLNERPYITSQYSQNKTEGLAEILRQNGYYTAFMHGGANGTMDFDKFCFMSGFDDYFGRDQYPKDKDYDGHWGIYDEPYLNYCVQTINQFKQPFLTGIFTLSSHHPYNVPLKYKNKFPKGTLEIHESIGYTDYALRQFFLLAQKESWYNNTLFVITADHTSISETFYYQREFGAYAVPIIFYHPSHPNIAQHDTISLTQQIDIMPSVLHYLGYSKPFYAIGQSVFDSTRVPFVINFSNQNYWLSQGEYSCSFSGESLNSIYKFRSDSTLKKDQHLNPEAIKIWNKELFPHLKAVIQTYNNDIIHNRTFVKPTD